jgi:hypothetical protein
MGGGAAFQEGLSARGLTIKVKENNALKHSLMVQKRLRIHYLHTSSTTQPDGCTNNTPNISSFGV